MSTQVALRFDGATYDHARDSSRLGDQMFAVYAVMADGRWRTLAELAAAADAPEASVSARLRDLRKPRFGGHRVERRYVCKGLFAYQLLVNEEQTA